MSSDYESVLYACLLEFSILEAANLKSDAS